MGGHTRLCVRGVFCASSTSAAVKFHLRLFGTNHCPVDAPKGRPSRKMQEFVSGGGGKLCEERKPPPLHPAVAMWYWPDLTTDARRTGY